MRLRLCPGRFAGFISVAMGLMVACGGQVWAQASPMGQPASSPPASAQPGLPAQPESASGWRQIEPAQFSRRAVVTAHGLATQAAWDVLRQGGNAVDAAIAAQWVLGLVEPQSSGPGGGAFVILSKGDQVLAYDGRETAPAAAKPDQFMRMGKPMGFADATRLPQAVGIPGAVALLWDLHQAHGRLPWVRLTRPAQRLAEQGFPMSPRLRQLLTQNASALPTAASSIYLQADGQAKPVGQLVRNPGYARLMRDVGRQGRKGFDQGPWAKALLLAVNAQGSEWMNGSELAAYRAIQRPALCHPLAASSAWPQGLKACGMPPPSSGQLAIAQWLGVWDAQGRRLFDAKGHLDGEALHPWVEAGRLAFADRASHVSDPEHAPHPLPTPAELLSEAYLAERARLVGDRRMPRALPGQWPMRPAALMADQPERGTSHVSIVDGQGMALAMTTTIEQAFGSRRLVSLKGLAGGYWLNNQLTDFSFAPTDAQGQAIANQVQAGKRPRSSMSPMLVFAPQVSDKPAVVMVLGSPGGAAIISHVALRLQALREGLPAQAAAELPNLAVLSPDGPLALEASRWPAGLDAQLHTLGHPVVSIELTSGLGLLMNTPQGWQVGVDPRREGVALGD